MDNKLTSNIKRRMTNLSILAVSYFIGSQMQITEAYAYGFNISGIRTLNNHDTRVLQSRSRSRLKSFSRYKRNVDLESMKSSDGNDEVGISSSTDTIMESRALTPNHILHPLYFPFTSNENGEKDESLSKSEKDAQEYKKAVQPLSFPMAMRKMAQALESLVEARDDPSMMSLRLGNNIEICREASYERQSHSETINGSSGANGMKESSKKYTIQIAQKVNHPIDTLCWLHANQPRIDALTSLRTLSKTQKPPMIYLSNAENTFQAASIGSAFKTHNLSEEYWNVIKSLPSGSGVYGGKRFDQKGEISQEWKEFGKEIWILPLIELRQEKPKQGRSDFEMTMMVHLHFDTLESLVSELGKSLDLLGMVTSDVSQSVPCTTLPPILSRGYNPDAQDVFENGVNEALQRIEGASSSDDVLEKVVLARRADLHFAAELRGLDIMKKLKFSGSVGHLFYINPGDGAGKEFLGCTPERLFQVRGEDGIVISEALAGTRPRGSTSEDDAELLRDLMKSEKDKKENVITGQFIQAAFERLVEKGALEMDTDSGNGERTDDGRFFVRRLRHLQHICQSFEGRIANDSSSVDITRFLLDELHPTPAVCGFPAKESIEFIREFETCSFDRGMYAGPFGFLSSDSADIIVAIRSGLLTKANNAYYSGINNVLPAKLSVYAGAGIVAGSTVQGEWSETGLKLGVLSSQFAQSPLTLKSFQTPNEAWATAFVEELIRSGVTQFYVCPGSRSTPLTAALARATRSHVGIIDCISTHDERGAAFRALGYARATKRPAAVVTSSGTAVANLYPAIMEASMDGVPLLLLTADRPYENRDTGANQAVDQIKVSMC